MISDNDDPDWEAAAEAAEAEEKRAEFLKNVGIAHQRIQTSHCLDVARLPAGTRLVAGPTHQTFYSFPFDMSTSSRKSVLYAAERRF